VTVIVVVPGIWRVTVMLVGDADSVKFATGALTVTLSAEDVEAEKFVSPPYCAVIECTPTASVDVEYVAIPPAIVPIPIDVAPSSNVTVPVIVPAVAELTVAVNVTLVPFVDGFNEDDTAVVVAAFVEAFTTCVTAIEVHVA
jgi:hypothetical protein